MWGIPTPIVCEYRRERMIAIGERLSKEDFDIVVLQEVWLKSDYKILVDNISPVMPYTHYFYSGMLGSGVCIFSKGPISDIQFFRFHLNGFAYKLQHGDWFGGKGIGMCKVDYKGLKVNIFTAHLHAEYNRLNDGYLAHRIAQSFELSQVVKLTSGPDCDVAILAGDLNLEPVDLGFKVICANAGLNDAWIQKVSTNKDTSPEGYTCTIPGNSFSYPSQQKDCPYGKRIDYILYKSSPMKSVICEQCYIPFSKIPDRPYNYSDHEALCAVFDVTTAAEPNLTHPQDTTTLTTLLNQATSVIDNGITQTIQTRTVYKGIVVQ